MQAFGLLSHYPYKPDPVQAGHFGGHTMKKLLLVTTALAGVALMSAPASAAVKLDLGGYFRGYGVWADNDEAVSMHEFDLRRNTEVHVSGETTLDNGLTVGFHTEQELGGATMTDEAYAYFSGGWGRFNVGSEDGAAYLLQVGAPSADSNVDGLRTYVQALAPAAAVFGAAGATVLGLNQTSTIDYDHISDTTDAHNTERLSYMTPKFNGFQAGVSFAPTQGQQAGGSAIFPLTSDITVGQYDNIWEAGARWDGEYQGFGISAGAGYSDSSLEARTALAAAIADNANLLIAPVVNDGLTQWNAGLNLAFSGFSLGGSYLRAETSMLDNIDSLDGAGGVASQVSMDIEQETWVIGAAYDNGPWHVGTSYLNQNISRDASGAVAADGEVSAVDAETQRYTIGGGYTFGPGMTFRGAVAWGEFEDAARLNDAGVALDGLGAVAATSQDFSQVTVGTDIQF